MKLVIYWIVTPLVALPALLVCVGADVLEALADKINEIQLRFNRWAHDVPREELIETIRALLSAMEAATFSKDGRAAQIINGAKELLGRVD